METAFMLMTPRRISMLLGVILAAMILPSCSQVNIKSYRLLEAPATSPTDPDEIEILPRPPLRRHIELGRIVASPEGAVDNATIEEAIRKEAAKMGANAVIIGYQGEAPKGFSISGFPGSAEARRETGRVVRATAIKWEGERLLPRFGGE